MRFRAGARKRTHKSRRDEALRDQEFDGEVVLLAAERHQPYDRPPLSKDYLAGSASFEDDLIESEDWYGEQRIDLRLGRTS